MGAVSFPIRAVAENWGTDATLAIVVTVIDERTGAYHTEETWAETRQIFPGQNSASANDPADSPAPPSAGRGPSGTVSFVHPEPGQTVAATRFPILALAETWGVETSMLISVTVTDVATGHLSYASCRCITRPRFPGQASQASY